MIIKKKREKENPNDLQTVVLVSGKLMSRVDAQTNVFFSPSLTSLMSGHTFG